MIRRSSKSKKTAIILIMGNNRVKRMISSNLNQLEDSVITTRLKTLLEIINQFSPSQLKTEI